MKYNLILLLLVVLLSGCGGSDENASIFKEIDEVGDKANIKIKENKEKEDIEKDILKPLLSKEKLENREKYIISVIQSDDYYEYFESFKSIYNSLELLGWIKKTNIYSKDKHTYNSALLEDLVNYDYSDYLEFSNDLSFSFQSDENLVNSEKFQNIIKSMKNGEIDLVILLGTTASKILLNMPDYNVPTIMDAVSDPLGSGLVMSEGDSGKDFLTARIDKNQYVRQVRLFYDVVKFESLGIIYEDSEDGRAYAAVDAVEKVAKEKEFQLIVENDAMAEPTEDQFEQAYKMYLDSMSRISPKIDAIFLGISGGLEDENLGAVNKKLIEYKMPSFTMEGSYVVKKGAMLGVSGKETGMYNAQKLVKILKGVKARSLSQKYEKTPKISINLKMAEMINYDIPVDIIKSSDEIYYTVRGVDSYD